MRRLYESPDATLLELCKEDIMTGSPSLDVGGTGDAGGSFDFNDWLNKLSNNGEGVDGETDDIGDLANGAS